MAADVPEVVAVGVNCVRPRRRRRARVPRRRPQRQAGRGLPQQRRDVGRPRTGLARSPRLRRVLGAAVDGGRGAAGGWVLPGAARDHRRGRRRRWVRDERPGPASDELGGQRRLQRRTLLQPVQRARAAGAGRVAAGGSARGAPATPSTRSPTRRGTRSRWPRCRPGCPWIPSGRPSPWARGSATASSRRTCTARVRAAQPRLAAAHLGGRRLRDRHPRLGAGERRSRHVGLGARHGHRRRLAGPRQPRGGRRRARRQRRRPRVAGRSSRP